MGRRRIPVCGKQVKGTSISLFSGQLPLHNLHSKPIVCLITVQTKFFVSAEADQMLRRTLPAAAAADRTEDPGRFRKTKLRLFYLKHILRFAALIITEGFLLCHALGPWFQHQTRSFPAFSGSSPNSFMA